MGTQKQLWFDSQATGFQEDLISKVEAKEAAREEKEEGKEFVEDGFARHFLW